MDKVPAVSVIIPVYNAECFLQECLDSLFRQTFTDYEVICVDDGSTDSSLRILKKYEEREPRLMILSQDHESAGKARNLGLSRASGRYLLFLDADDRFASDMLAAAFEKAENDAADICVFAAEVFNDETEKVLPLPSACRPTNKQKSPFSRTDDPDWIFRFTVLAPWNKFFRREFIVNSRLCFSNLPNSNDLTFVLTALASANRITTVCRPLVQCRVNNSASLQGSKDKAPLCFYDALLALRQNLKARSLYDDLERPFINQAAAVILYNLLSSKTDASFEKIFTFMKQTGIDELKLRRPAGYYYHVPYEDYSEMARLLKEESIEAFAETFQVSAPGYRMMKRLSFSERIRTMIRKIVPPNKY